MNAVASIACMGLMLSAGSAMAGPNNFDGVWKVHLVTNSGSCGRNHGYSVAFRDGLIHGDASGGSMTGKVGQNGAVVLTIQHSLASANGLGRLGANSGSGSWRVDMLGCSGRWTAAREA